MSCVSPWLLVPRGQGYRPFPRYNAPEDLETMNIQSSNPQSCNRELVLCVLIELGWRETGEGEKRDGGKGGRVGGEKGDGGREGRWRERRETEGEKGDGGREGRRRERRETEGEKEVGRSEG